MRKVFRVLWLYVVCFGITGNAGECLAASETDYTIPRHLEYSFELQNTTNQVREQVDLWTYAPVPLTATQQRVHVDASHPFEELSDEAGNSILHFTLLDIPPYATKIITIRTDLLLSETPLPIDVPHTSRLQHARMSIVLTGIDRRFDQTRRLMYIGERTRWKNTSRSLEESILI